LKKPNISNGDLRRLARKGGIMRLSPLCYKEAETALRKWLKDVIEKVCLHHLLSENNDVRNVCYLRIEKKRNHYVSITHSLYK
jgi:hypothetical protein